jgi:hypothetical protein
MRSLLLLFPALTAISGFAVSLIDTWDLWYAALLIIHPAIGVITTIYFVYVIFQATQRNRAVKIRKTLSAIATVLVLILLSVGTVADKSKGLFFIAIFYIFLVTVFHQWKAIKKNTENYQRLKVFNLVAGIWFELFYSGFMILITYQSGGVKYLFQGHGFFAGAFLIIVIISTIAYWKKIKTWPWSETLNPPTILKGNLLLFGICFGLAVIFRWELERKNPSFTLHLSTIPIEERALEERQTYYSDASFNPVGIGLVKSCTTGEGCHKSLEKGFLISNHNISMTTPHFQKNMALLVSEIGEKNALICAGCHFPSGLFDRTKNYSYFRTHNNFSCSFCHMIDKVRIVDSRRSQITITPPLRHLKLFMSGDRESIPKPFQATMIKLSPLAHARAFSKPLHRQNEFCVSCHHHQIGLYPKESMVRPRCADCHMQPQDQIGMPGRLRNHFMPGSNLAVPYLAGKSEAVSIIQKWVKGEFGINLGGWENVWRLKSEKAQTQPMTIWIYMNIDFMEEPVSGKDFDFKVIATNIGMEHPFPAGPLDLVEAWLEVRVEDDAGTLLLYNGGIDPVGAIDAEAKRLGGYMIGKDNHIVTKNRVWQIQKKVVQRIIMPNRQAIDSFRVNIPESTVGTIKISASWNYRKIPLDFAEWVYGNGVNIPYLRVGSVVADIRIREPLPTK